MPTTLPLTNSPSQTFEVDFESAIYTCRVAWNSRAEWWFIDILDADEVVLINGVPLLLGSNIIEQYNLGIGGLSVINTEGTEEDATSENLGTTVLLIHLTEAELEVS